MVLCGAALLEQSSVRGSGYFALGSGGGAGRYAADRRADHPFLAAAGDRFRYPAYAVLLLAVINHTGFHWL